MIKAKVVVFEEPCPRVLVNPEEADIAGKVSVENPDLTEVLGLPPHQWALVEGRIVPADAKLVEERENALFKHLEPTPAPVKQESLTIEEPAIIEPKGAQGGCSCRNPLIWHAITGAVSVLLSYLIRHL